MRIAVGSTREPKLAGVRSALQRLAAVPWPGGPVELVAVDAASGQADTPLEAVLRNWAVAWDGVREGVGSSAGILLPEPVAAEVLAGEDLASVIDCWAAEHDVRSRQGAFGVLTLGLVSRADAYAQAVLTALAPFYAPGWSGSGRRAPRR